MSRGAGKHGGTGFLRSVEQGFAVVSLTLFTGAVLALLRQGGEISQNFAQSDPLLQAVFLAIYAVTALLLLARWRESVRVLTQDRLLLLLLIVALASVLWSEEPEVTLRRSVALVGTSMFGLYLAARYGLGTQLRLLAWAFGIAAVLSLFFALALPGYGISSAEHEGAWRGVYVHKNSLGRLMSTGAIVFLILAVYERRRLAWLGLGLSMGLLLLSTSRTALVVFLAIPPVLVLHRALRWRSTAAVPFLIAGVLSLAGLGLVLAGNAESTFDALGRDLTFSDRTELWVLTLDAIRERPWLGYGYSGFWLGWEGESASLWLLGWQVAAADNGYLDLLLNLGLAGLFVFALGFLSAYLRAVSWLRRTTDASGLWPATYLSFLLLYNLTESTFLVQNNIFWVLYVATALSTFAPRRRTPVDRTRKGGPDRSVSGPVP